MKALLVADNELVIEHVSTVLKTAGYDIITYHALLKALDNIEEIAPHLIVISTKEYPRHWKTLAQYATVPLGSYTPQVILYTDGALGEEDQKKAQALHIRGTFASIDVDGLDELRAILAEKDDIFAGSLNELANEVKPIEIPDDFATAHADDEQMLEEFVEEEVAHPGESLEKIGQQIETEVVRASSPLEAANATEDDETDVEEPEELAETEAEEAQPQAAPISIDDILKQNQSFNRFADIPDIKTEEEAKSGGEKTYDFGNIKGRREDAGDLGKSPMDLWAEIEAEEGGMTLDDEPEPEPNFNPIAISLDELANLKHVDAETEQTEPTEETASDSAESAETDALPAEDTEDDRLAEIDRLAEADEQEAGMNFRPISESLAALADGDDLSGETDENAAEEPANDGETAASAEAEDAAETDESDRLAEIDRLAEADEQEAGMNFRPISESLAALANGEDLAGAADEDEAGAETEAAAENAEPEIVENPEPDEPPLTISEDELEAARQKSQDDAEAVAKAYAPVTPVISENLAPVDPSLAITEDDVQKARDTASVSISLDELLKAQKAAEGDKAKRVEMENSVKEKMQKVAENAANVALDPENPVSVTQQEVDAILDQNQATDGDLGWLSNENADEPEPIAEADFDEPVGMSAAEADDKMGSILSQNQFTMKNNIDWLAKENADEPDHPEPDLDDIADPTGTSAQEVAESMSAILEQNQKTDSDLDWLSNENADEPEHPLDIDDNAEPTGRAAADVDNDMGDILRQNQFTMKNNIDWLSKENADEPDHPEAIDDDHEPVGMAAAEVDNNLDDILSQNQTTDKELDWLSNENADEPELIDTDALDDLSDETGEKANDVALSVQDILQQNQIMDRQLAWLSDENADEPEAPLDAQFDDNTEPTGMSASERDASVQDILTQNQTKEVDEFFALDMEKLQALVDKLNILRSIVCTVMLTNPETGALISGSARNYTRNQLEFTPDIPELAKNFRDGTVIDNASLKTEDGIEAVSATVISTAEPLIIAINHHGK